MKDSPLNLFHTEYQCVNAKTQKNYELSKGEFVGFLHFFNIVFCPLYTTGCPSLRSEYTMSTMLHLLRVLMFVAGSCLVANDVVRVLFPGVQQVFIAQICDQNEQDDNNNSINAFSFFEEEVKHSGKDRFYPLPLVEGELEVAVAHLVRDDDVRHLAYIPIFSPPPDLS